MDRSEVIFSHRIQTAGCCESAFSIKMTTKSREDFRVAVGKIFEIRGYTFLDYKMPDYCQQQAAGGVLRILGRRCAGRHVTTDKSPGSVRANLQNLQGQSAHGNIFSSSLHCLGVFSSVIRRFCGLPTNRHWAGKRDGLPMEDC